MGVLCHTEREENAGKYYSVFSMPVNLSRFDLLRHIILVEKNCLVSAIFLACFSSISNIICSGKAVYSSLHSVVGSIGIILCVCLGKSLCGLYLARKKRGMLCADCVKYNYLDVYTYLLLHGRKSNRIGGLYRIVWAANWHSRLWEFEINGTFILRGIVDFYIHFIISIALSILLFLISYCRRQKDFFQREVDRNAGFIYCALSETVKNKHTPVWLFLFVLPGYRGIFISSYYSQYGSTARQ